MSINEIFPMRKRRSLNKTPGRSSTTSIEARRPQETPKRITSNSSFTECEIVWDNHSPSPTRTLLGKRKKQATSDGSSSENNDIADMVKKLPDKTGQTPKDSSLYSFWFGSQETQPAAKVPNVDRKTELKTPSRPSSSRLLRKARKIKNTLNKELELLASMMKNADNNRSTDEFTNNGIDSSNNNEATTVVTSTPQSTKQQKILDEKGNTPTNCSKITKNTGCVKPKLSSPLSDIVNIDWEDDDIDDMLSQVDVSKICGGEVVTNTQHSILAQKESLNIKGKQNFSIIQDNFVTESWDFDDSADLIQTLEQVESVQHVSRHSLLQPLFLDNEKFNCLSKGIKTEARQCTYFGEDTDCRFQPKQEQRKELVNSSGKENDQSKTVMVRPVCSKEEIERKRLEAKERLKQKEHLRSLDKNTTQSKAIQGSSVYSKEDIERKRLEAKERLKQKKHSRSLDKNTAQIKAIQASSVYSKEEIECKRLEAKERLKQKGHLRSLDKNTVQSKTIQARSAYSKEDIERKRLEAKQKQTQKEHLNRCSSKIQNVQTKTIQVKSLNSNDHFEHKRLQEKLILKDQICNSNFRDEQSKVLQVKGTYTKDDIERKRLEAKQKQMQKQQPVVLKTMVDTNQIKHTYSKEDIERKKIKAQQKQKQRLELQISGPKMAEFT